MRPADHRVADLQGTFANEHGRRGTHSRLKLRLDDAAFRGTLRRGPQLHDLRLQQDHLQQLVEILLGRCRHIDGDRLAAPRLRAQAVFLQLLLHAIGIGRGQIALVDRDDDRHLRGFRMVHGLEGLRHDAVVGRDN